MTDPDEVYTLTSKGFDALQQEETELTDEQLFVLRIVAGREARELEPLTIGEMEPFLQWFQEVMTSMALVELVLDGDVYMDMPEGEDEPVFSISSQGLQTEEILRFTQENN